MTESAANLCNACGYNLRGLPLGNPCPECGVLNRSAYVGGIHLSGAKDIALSQMPEQLVRRIAFCCVALFLAVFVVVARFFISIQVSTGVGSSIDVVVSLLWVLSVYLVTNPMSDTEAVWRGLGREGRVRLVARWATTAAVVFAVALSVPRSHPIYPIALFIIFVSGIASAIGMLCLFSLLSQLAQWCRDTSAKRCLDTATWGAPMVFVLVEPLRLFPLPPQIVATGEFVCIAFVLCGPLGMAMLMSSSIQAVSHAREYQEYMERKTTNKNKWPPGE